jgi:hypothetical protein
VLTVAWVNDTFVQLHWYTHCSVRQLWCRMVGGEMPHADGVHNPLHTMRKGYSMPYMSILSLVHCFCCRSYQLQVHTGGVLAGDKAQYYGGQPIAYGLDPCENVLFCGCHDNETIFDQVQQRCLWREGGRSRSENYATAILPSGCMLPQSAAAMAVSVPG